MDAGHPSDGSPAATMVIDTHGRRWRQVHAAFIGVVVALLIATVAFEVWLSALGLVLTLLGQTLTAQLIWGRVKLDVEGIELDQRVRRQRIAWSAVATFRVSWEGGFRPQAPHVTRRDGEQVRSTLLVELGRHRHTDQRRRLTAFLEARAAEHGFTLEVTEPTRIVS